MNEIHCKNCGAYYPETVSACPYCGAENEALAKSRHESQLGRLWNRVREVYERIAHRETANQAARRLITVAALAVCAVIVVVIAVNYARSKRAQSGRLAENVLPVYEALYEEGDYAALYEKLDADDNLFVKGTYAKYDNAARLYHQMTFDFSSLERSLSWSNSSYMIPYLEKAMQHALTLRAWKEDGFRYDEEKAYDDLTVFFYEQMRTLTKLTDTEIDDILEALSAGDENLDLSECVLLIKERNAP